MHTFDNPRYLAKLDMHNTKPSVYFASLLYFVLLTVFSVLVTKLSGIDAFYDRILALINTNVDITTFTAEALQALMPKITTIAALLILAINLMNGIISIGFYGYALKVSRKQPTKPTDIFCSFELLGKSLMLFVLQTLLIFLWTLLFIVPGIIASFRYSQSYFILFDNPEMSVYQCLRESSKMMQGHKATLFFLIFSFIGWLILDNLLGMLVGIQILTIYITPYMTISRAHFYNELVGYPYVPYDKSDKTP